MRFGTVFTAMSLSSSVLAAYPRQLPGFPSCANTCLNEPTNLGGCQETDETCLCKSLVFVETTFACIMAACQGADQQTAINGAESLCLNFGVTLAAESSSIVAGLSTISSGAFVTGNPGVSTSATPAPTASTGAARHLASGYIFATAAVACAAARLLI
ncbi:hypothetical protein C8F04DRAFT_20543 [Mycena alexandri]|uniref:CFEM domain-containing protein n=1 Tax=Mycena alexandri TaxID=1745969 RepID=A0AAD6XGX7_9AGAR|nr:hypothetical protein C8F04DRAFT_20543 [Mycena alexandri]